MKAADLLNVDIEPSDSELRALMSAVDVVARRRAQASDEHLQQELAQATAMATDCGHAEKLNPGSGASERQPVLVVVGGPNGSGKTSLTTEFLAHGWLGCRCIDPNNIARDVFGDWNSPSASLQAAQFAELERNHCLAEGASIAFESVLSTPDKLAFMRRAQEAGYFVRLFFVGTEHPSINAARVARRVMEGGHDVPIPKIISRYARSIANCAAAISFVDRAYVYDNSVDGVSPRLLLRSEAGAVVRQYGEIANWAKLLVEESAAQCALAGSLDVSG